MVTQHQHVSLFFPTNSLTTIQDVQVSRRATWCWIFIYKDDWKEWMYYQRVCSGWTQCKENIMQNQRHQRFTVILITGVNIIESNLSPNSFEVPSMHFWCNILTFHCVWCSILETALSDFVFLSFYSVTCKLFYLKKTFITKKQHLLWSKFFILIINNVKWALKFLWNMFGLKSSQLLWVCFAWVWTFCMNFLCC